MLKVILVEKGVAQKELFFDTDEVSIGRTANNGVVLPKPNVSKRHAVIQVKDGHVVVNDMKSTNGTWVGGRKIDGPQQLKEKDFVFIGDYAISVSIVDPDAATPSPEPSVEVPAEPPTATVAMSAVDVADMPPVGLPPDMVPPPLPEDSVVDEIPAPEAVEPPSVDVEIEVEMEEPAVEPAAAPEPVKETPKEPAPKPAKAAQKAPEPEPAPAEPPAVPSSGVAGLAKRLGYDAGKDRYAAMRALAEVAAREVFASVDPGKADFSDAEWLKLSDSVMRLVDRLRRDNRITVDADPVEMTQQVLYEFAGLGPLEDLLSTQDARAIIVNGLRSIQVVDDSGSKTIDAVFSSESTFDRVVTKLCILAGTAPASKDDPLVEGHLPDGSLLQVIGRPFVQEGRMIVIERPVGRMLTAAEFESECGATPAMVAMLQAAVVNRRNIVVCGVPYTTRCVFINSLTAMIARDRRILVLGGGPESALDMPNLVAMSRSAVLDSSSGCAQLVGRVFPDHVVLGNVENNDAGLLRELGLGGFQGMVLGMVANSAEDCVNRLRLMLQFSAPGIDAGAVDDLTARLTETILVLALTEDGKTVISQVYENNARGNLTFPARYQWTISYAGIPSDLTVETEIPIENSSDQMTDPGAAASEAAIEVQAD